MKQTLSIVIAGGGVGGLALAIRLKQFGINSLVVEKQNLRQLKGPQLKGEYFQPQGVALLDQLGLLSEISKHSLKIKTVSHRFHDPVSRESALFKTKYNNSRKWNYGLAIFHENILQVFRDQFLKMGGVILDGVRIERITKAKDGFALNTSNGQEFHADIFVGSDGRYGVTRKLLGLSPKKFDCNRYMAAALVTGLKVPKGEFYTEEIHEGVVYAFCYPKGITRVYVCFDKSELNEALKDKEAFFLKKIRETMIVGKNRAQVHDRVMMMPTDDMMLETSHLGSAIWMGDAAGTLDPLGGHGMSVAMSQAARIATAIRVADQVPERTSALLEKVSQLNQGEYLQARFLSLWIGYLFMNSSLINRLAKRHVLARYMSDGKLRTYSADFFGGVSDRPVSLLDVPYLLGVVPTSLMNVVKSAKVDHFMIDFQNQALVNPSRLSGKFFTKKALALARNYLKIPQMAEA
jgi:2-polyprenyl-6-methoxyphenol hydroxylase-like FAD-dependent oxidoreductase